MAEWERELSVDPEAVRLEAGAPRAWRLLASGWDADAWLADESVVWRVPRRTVGIAALEREAALMPVISPRLPAPAPVPRLVRSVGLPPLAWHACLPGRELALAGDASESLGRSLGRFVAALHGPDLAELARPHVPVDPLGRADPAKRVPFTHRRLDQVAHLVDVGPLRAVVDRGAGPALPTDVLCHGDLHLRHVLVDAGGDLAGVIDWGDACIGARAMDLAIATALESTPRRAFLAAYGAVSPPEWRHARLLGVLFGAALLAADPDGEVGSASRAWLERLAGEDEAVG